MFFKPAVWWMNRLTYSEKFLWLGAILLVAFGVLVHSLQGHLEEEAKNIQAERVGITYSRLATLAIQQIQQHRGRSASVLGGNQAMRIARTQKAKDANAAVDALIAALPANLQRHPELQQITKDWRDIQNDGMGWSVATNFQAHTALIDKLLNFLITLSDSQHLVLDSDIGTYYLIDLVINKIPALTERMGKLRAYGAAMVSKREISDPQYYELLTLLAELRAIHDQVQRNLKHAEQVNPDELKAIKASGSALRKENEKLAALVEQHITSRTFSIEPEVYFVSTTRAIDTVYGQLFGVLYPTIGERLTARMAVAQSHWYQTLVVLAGLLLIATYLIIGGYFSITGGMRRVLGAIKTMAGGDVTTRVQLESRDEIAQIGQGFNEMGDAIELLIAERDADHRELKKRAESLLLAGRVFEEAYEGISITDTQGVILDVNPMYCKMTGFTRDELVGATHRKVRGVNSTPQQYQDLWGRLAKTGHWQGELWNQRKDGTEFAVELTITALRGENGEVLNYVGLCSEITELKLHHEKMERLAHHDPLTGLPNRALLSDRLQQALVRSRRSGEVVAVVGIDLDGFKAVNDRLGHEAGDILLKEIAARFENAVRAGDTVARLGGDEFILVLCDAGTHDDCAHTLQRILAAINQPVKIGEDKKAHVSGSLGYTLFPEDNADPDTLMRHADLAMYAAKQAGKNRFVRFDHQLDRKQQANANVLSRLEKGLLRNEFALYVQPKLDQVAGRLAGAEVLLRWNHPVRGLIPPGEFFPVIEKDIPLSILFDTWVLENSLRLMADWRRAGIGLRLSINVSSHQLLRHDFSTQLMDSLAKYPELSGADLEIEILESVALDDVPQVAELIRACQGAGIRFSLDDFGTGYSTLTYLKQLSVNTLKIDQSFVRDMERDPNSRAIVQGVIGLASAFKYDVVAEGVETEAQAASLKAMGCAVIQGYLVARPMPAADLPAWISQYFAASKG